MNSSERLCLLLNPHSAGGATAGRIADIRAAAERYFGAVELRVTEHSGHATELARAAAEEGFEVIAAVGGDGTINEVVNGLVVDGVAIHPGGALAVVPAGTGGDLVKTLGMSSNLDEAFAVIAAGETRATDLVQMELTDPLTGGTIRRLGINVVGWGMNGAVVKLANEGTKRFGGRMTFLSATLRALARYRHPSVTLRWQDSEGRDGEWSGPLTSAFLANGQYCGGGMWVGRGGSMQDGLLDLTVLPQMSIARSTLLTPRLYAGTMERMRGVTRVAVRDVSAIVDAGEDVLVDIDGEQPGRLPLRGEILAGALRIRANW